MPAGFTNFPKGTCLDISDILAEYLYSKGFENIQNVSGRFNNSSHAWLEYEGKVIDITADQFDEICDKVLIQKSELWHSKFEDITRRKAGFKNMHGQAISDINSVYYAVISQLNA